MDRSLVCLFLPRNYWRGDVQSIPVDGFSRFKNGVKLAHGAVLVHL
jgi:hypothetical protein